MQNIIFDVFGTLIGNVNPRVNPYRKLMMNLDLDVDPHHYFMAQNKLIDEFAIELGMESMIPVLKRELKAEMEDVHPFQDTYEVLNHLRHSGSQIVVCSNLSADYGPLVKKLLPDMDGYVFSYEVGAIKPDPAIYQKACDTLGCLPGQALFVGDSLKCDVEGPQRFGMQARHIDRKNNQPMIDVLFPQKGVQSTLL